MKGVFGFLKREISNLWFFHRMKVYIGFGIILFFVILSFFIDIGYILTIIAIFGIIEFSKRVSKEEPDVLKIEENKVLKEQQELEQIKKELYKELSLLEEYIEKNPTDFVAWKRKAEIEEFLNDF